jgi:hypothetical protein
VPSGRPYYETHARNDLHAIPIHAKMCDGAPPVVHQVPFNTCVIITRAPHPIRPYLRGQNSMIKPMNGSMLPSLSSRIFSIALEPSGLTGSSSAVAKSVLSSFRSVKPNSVPLSSQIPGKFFFHQQGLFPCHGLQVNMFVQARTQIHSIFINDVCG